MASRTKQKEEARARRRGRGTRARRAGASHSPDADARRRARRGASCVVVVAIVVSSSGSGSSAPRADQLGRQAAGLDGRTRCSSGIPQSGVTLGSPTRQGDGHRVRRPRVPRLPALRPEFREPADLQRRPLREGRSWSTARSRPPRATARTPRGGFRSSPPPTPPARRTRPGTTSSSSTTSRATRRTVVREPELPQRARATDSRPQLQRVAVRPPELDVHLAGRRPTEQAATAPASTARPRSSSRAPRARRSRSSAYRGATASSSPPSTRSAEPGRMTPHHQARDDRPGGGRPRRRDVPDGHPLRRDQPRLHRRPVVHQGARPRSGQSSPASPWRCSG